jgi:diguanylate cyclase
VSRKTSSSQAEWSLRWIRLRRAVLARNPRVITALVAVVAGALMALLLWLLAAPLAAVLSGALFFALSAAALTGAFTRMLQDLELARQRQKERASRDGTTGVDTRRRFLANAKREMVRAGRYGHPMSLLWVEVDRFDALREAQGDLNAERLLRAVVGLIRGAVRLPDTVGRMSGPLFAVVLPHTDPLGALDVAERIRAHIDTAAPRIDGRIVKVAVSVGTAALDPRHTTLANLLADVESALRQAQQAGGNVVRMAAFRSKPKSGAADAVDDVTPGIPGHLQLPFQPSGTPQRRSGDA